MQPFGELHGSKNIKDGAFWFVGIQVLPNHSLVPNPVGLPKLKLAHSCAFRKQLPQAD